MKQRKKQQEVRELPRLPEMRKPDDCIAMMGKRLRDRYDALRPHSDLKNWR